MAIGEMAQAINQAIDGTINLGFGIYDRYKQNQLNILSQKQWEQLRQDNLHAFSNTVKDMQSVGVSPLAMQGLNPTGSAMTFTAGGSPINTGFGKTAGEIANRKQTKELAEKEFEFNNAKLEAEKAKAETEKVQAESVLAETVRHNKAQEEISRNSGNWFNIIANKFLNTDNKDKPKIVNNFIDSIEESGKEYIDGELKKGKDIVDAVKNYIDEKKEDKAEKKAKKKKQKEQRKAEMKQKAKEFAENYRK